MHGPTNSTHRQRTSFLVGILRPLGGRRGFHSFVRSREEVGQERAYIGAGEVRSGDAIGAP